MTKQAPRGYSNVPCADPKEAALRKRWYSTLGTPDHDQVNKELADYVYTRTQRLVEEDRRKHPKAKRNAPKGSESKKTPVPEDLPK